MTTSTMDTERRLDTREAAEFLTERGYRTAPTTLNKLRCVGGGPEFDLFGRRPLYTPTQLLEYARRRTRTSLRSTSDKTTRQEQFAANDDRHVVQV